MLRDGCAREDGDELIAAVTTDDRARPGKRPRDCTKHGIADLVTVCIVERLHAVDVGHDNREPCALLLCELDHLGRDGCVVQAVRQRVSARLLAQDLFRSAALGGVTEAPDAALDLGTGDERTRIAFKDSPVLEEQCVEIFSITGV